MVVVCCHSVCFGRYLRRSVKQMSHCVMLSWVKFAISLLAQTKICLLRSCVLFLREEPSTCNEVHTEDCHVDQEGMKRLMANIRRNSTGLVEKTRYAFDKGHFLGHVMPIVFQGVQGLPKVLRPTSRICPWPWPLPSTSTRG